MIHYDNKARTQMESQYRTKKHAYSHSKNTSTPLSRNKFNKLEAIYRKIKHRNANLSVCLNTRNPSART